MCILALPCTHDCLFADVDNLIMQYFEGKMDMWILISQMAHEMLLVRSFFFSIVLEVIF